MRTTSDGFYRNVSDIRDWNSTWQVQNLSLSGLIDIAHETPNANFGPTEGSTAPKPVFVRHPSNPEYYDLHPTLGRVGFGNVTQAVLDANPNFYKEDVGGYLLRSIRYIVETTHCDGFRLDAVKHVPAIFSDSKVAPIRTRALPVILEASSSSLISRMATPIPIGATAISIRKRRETTP